MAETKKTETRPEHRTDERKPWTPLTFEKVDLADAEAGFFGAGPDNGIYS